MIRCLVGNHLIPRYPCPIHRTDRRDKAIALAVIQRDGRCVHCGNPNLNELDAGHIQGKAHGGPDSLANMVAECASRNRGGKCKGVK